MTGISQHRMSDVGGIRVVSEQIPSVRSVSLGVWIAVGSRDEADSSRGFAHFLEHLLFKGNDQFGAEDISRYFDQIGSDVNAATTKEYTVVHSRVIDRHVDSSLEVLGGMVLAPGFDPDELDSERQVILEEIAMYNDSPSDVVHELLDELVFNDHPLGLPIIGNVGTISAAGSGDVAAFHAGHYTPGTLVVSAAGNCTHEAVEASVRRHFLPLLEARAGATGHALPPRRRDDLRVPSFARAGVVQKDTEQVHICLAAQGVARDDDRRYAGAVLDTILGSTPSSRLFREVRELRGLAYSVYSFVSHYSDTGEIGVYVAVRPDRVTETLDVLATELDRIRTTTPAADELERAQDHLEGRLLLSLESTTVRGNRLGASLVTGMPIDPIETTIDRMRSVTADDVQQLAQELLDPGRMSFAAVADVTDPIRAAACSTLGFSSAQFDRGGTVTA